MKIKRLESALTGQKRVYENLKKRRRCAQQECAEGSKLRKRNTTRKRNLDYFNDETQPAYSSEDDNPYFSEQYRQESEAVDGHNSIQDNQWKTTAKTEDKEDQEGEDGTAPSGYHHSNSVTLHAIDPQGKGPRTSWSVRYQKETS